MLIRTDIGFLFVGRQKQGNLYNTDETNPFENVYEILAMLFWRQCVDKID